MRWITRDHVRVGRMGCAWLITHFIDPDSEFIFASGAELAREAERLGAAPFHVPGSETARQGDRSSFEVMLDRYNLTGDSALVLLGKIVGTADVHTSPWHQPEGPGLKATADGILAIRETDAERLATAAAVFDALYAYCQQQSARAKD